MGELLDALPHWAVLDGDDEDCLFVNVWTSAKEERKELLPVLVVSGGAHVNGGTAS